MNDGKISKAAFEAWWESTPILKENKRTIAEKAYQAGRAALQSQDREDAQPKLKVVVCSFPETNGKRNWTALLLREQPWEGLAASCGGITLAYGESWNRVAYVAERTKFLLGMRDTEPFILDYGVDIETPEQWLGEAIDHARRIEGEGK